MTDPIKLTTAGQSVTFACTACFQVPVGKFPEIEFQGMDGTTPLVIRVPKVSADRQLGRIPLTYEQAVGCRLTISRDPNPATPSKPYWGITLVSQGTGTAGASLPQGAGAGAHASPPTPVAPAPAEKRDVIYARITDWVLANIVPKYDAAGITCDSATVAAITATLYIDTRKHG